MEDNTLKALAENLAHQAVYGEPDPMVKSALNMGDIQSGLSSALENPALRNALLGAGAGGLMGLATGGEDKKRKALHYALLGGLGAGGLTLGANMLGQASAPPPKELQAPIKSTLGPAAKYVGAGLGAAGATVAAGYAPIAAKQVGDLARRGAMSAAWKVPALRGPVVGALKSKVPGAVAKNIGKLPTAGKLGIPAAGALLMYSLLNRGNN
jgi:hypothetical protein